MLLKNKVLFERGIMKIVQDNNLKLFKNYALKNYKKMLNNLDYFPCHFQIQTINICNGNCIMCPYTSQKRNIAHSMDNELFEKITNEISQKTKSDISVITLMLQNEPFLDKTLINKMEYINQFDNLLVNIVTNGTQLNKQIINKMEKLNLYSMTVSIDSINEITFNKIRPNFNFGKIMENIELIKNSNLKNKLTIKLVVQNKNESELENFVKYWKNKGINIQIQPPSNRAGALANFNDVKTDVKINSSIINYYVDFYDKLDFCPHPFYQFNILSNGDVIICCHDWKHNKIVGNVNKSSINEIWNSAVFKKYRKILLSGRGHDIFPCKDCSIIKNQN